MVQKMFVVVATTYKSRTGTLILFLKYSIIDEFQGLEFRMKMIFITQMKVRTKFTLR